MKSLQRIFLVLSLLITGIASVPARHTQAKALALTPGSYAGRFYYSVDWTLVDKQTHDDTTTDVNYIGSFDIGGLVTLQVGKNGKILPSVKISPNNTHAYELHDFKISSADCSVRSYLSADLSSAIKFKSAGTSDSFTSTVKLENVRPMHFEKQGSNSECPGFGSQALLTQWINDHIRFVNNTKNLNFIVVNASKDYLSGSIFLDSLPIRTTTPGGFIVIKDEGRFVLHKIDPLAPLDDDSLAPLVDDSLAPLGEWRTK